MASPTFTGTATIPNATVTNLYSSGDVSMGGNLLVSNTIYENGNSLVSTYATLASPTFTGTATIPNATVTNLYSSGDVSFNNNLYVDKKTLMNQDVSMNNNLDLSGSLIAHNNVNVYGIINQYTTTLDQGYIVNYSQINTNAGLTIGTNINGQNTFLGTSAGSAITSGINNTFLGFNSGTTTTSGSNNSIIGSGASASTASVSNEITIGNNSVTTLRCQATTITSLSDVRDKKNIEPIQLGLDFVNKLNPVKFTWDSRDGSKKDLEEFGFIAQELKQAQEEIGIILPNLVNENNPDKLEASYGTLIPVLVKAIKELTELTAKQQMDIELLKNKLNA